MLKHEAIFIGNLKRYSNYSGYGKTLEFTNTQRDGHKKDLIAIDAYSFKKTNMDE